MTFAASTVSCRVGLPREGAMVPSSRRVCVITGGASGIGLALAHGLVALEWDVVIADRDIPDAEGLNATCGFDAVRTDVMSTASVDSLFKHVRTRYRGLDALVNAAGFNRHQPAAELDDHTWITQFDVHLGGVIRCCRAGHSLLRDSGNGRIVNFSSVGAHRGRPNRAPYSAAKAGVEALTRSLAVEWAADSIRVNCVAPGWIDTQMIHVASAGPADRLTRISEYIPLRRLGTAEEAANAALFFISDASSYITGQCLIVDGGALINGDW